MALIQYGSVVHDARGSFAGLVFSHNLGGPFIRQKVSPIQPLAPAQKKVRGALTATSKTFQTKLTAAQVQAWNSFALTHPLTNRYGDQTLLTGQMWFTRLNHPLITLGLAIMLSPPADNFILAPGALETTQNASYPFGPLLTPLGTPPASLWARILASPLMPIARVHRYSRQATIATIPPGTAPPWDLTAAWVSKFGACPAPGFIHFEAKYTNATNGVQSKATTSKCPINTPFG